MTGRHAAADSIDDEAVADAEREHPPAHRAEGEPIADVKKPTARRRAATQKEPL